MAATPAILMLSTFLNPLTHSSETFLPAPAATLVAEEEPAPAAVVAAEAVVAAADAVEVTAAPAPPPTAPTTEVAAEVVAETAPLVVATSAAVEVAVLKVLPDPITSSTTSDTLDPTAVSPPKTSPVNVYTSPALVTPGDNSSIVASEGVTAANVASGTASAV